MYFDFHNQAVRVTDGTTTTENKYDALGRRLQKIVTAGSQVKTENFYHSGHQVIEVRDGNDQVKRQFIYGNGIDEVIRMDNYSGSTVTPFYFHSNAIGSTTAVTDADGQVVERYRYGLYGMPTFMDTAGNEIPNSAIGNNILFQGREYEPETNFYYFRARHLDPIMGRFISTDPMGYWDSMNLYQGFNMNPVNFVDPMGTVVNSKLVDHYGSLMAAEHNVRVTYSRFRQSGDSHADAYKKLINYGYVTHTGYKDDENFEFSLSTSPMYGSPKARKAPKKRPTAETIGDFAAGFGDEVSATLFDLFEAYAGGPPPSLEPQPRVVPTKIYREGLQNVLGLGEIKDMVDHESPAYEMGGYTWHGTAFTLFALDATYSSTNLLADIEYNLSYGDDIYVIGRKFDADIAKDWPGYKVLDETDWSIQLNDEYVQMIINKRAKVYLGSPTTPENLWDFEANVQRIFGREIQQLEAAGYTRVGNYMLPPK
jgi:RHS repeat-associated protein